MPETTARSRLSRMKQAAAFAAAFALLGALTVASGALHGRMRGRWGPSACMQAAADRLEPLPEVMGEWRLRARGELEQRVVEILQCEGSFTSTYSNERTGATATIVVVLGPVGPIAGHTPEGCIGGTHWVRTGPRQPVEIAPGDAPAEGGAAETDRFWLLDFQSSRAHRRVQRVYFAWSTGGPWMATNQPRWDGIGYPYLYKVQVSSILPPGTPRPVGAGSGPGADPEASAEPPDAAFAFLQAAAPHLRERLITPDAPAATAPRELSELSRNP